MEQAFLTDFGDKLVQYGREASVYDIQFWAYLIMPIIAIWMITTIMLYIFPFQRPGLDTKSRIFQINLKLITASLLVTTILTGLYIIYWKSNYYKNEPIQSSHLFSLVLTLTIAYFTYSYLKKLFDAEKIKDLTGQSITRNEETEKSGKAIRQFNRAKQLIAIPAIGFTLLLVDSNKESNLVSIILDTSISMEAENEWGQIPIETSQQILQSAIQEFRNTDLIITHFKQGEYKPDIAAITSIQDQNSLSGYSVFFPSAELLSAQRYISSLGINLTDDSPICETIWKNLIHTKEAIDKIAYRHIILIIITDGNERMKGSLDGFFCDNQEFENIYSAEGLVNFINLGGSTSTSFWDKVNECGYLIQEGSDAQSYLKSLDSILDEVKYDSHFVFAMACIYLVFALLIIIIQPKPIQ